MESTEIAGWYGQYQEDRLVSEHVCLPERGVFVDVGAGDGMTGSNTYYFEQQGWNGLCIDADPRQIEFLHQNRRPPIIWCAIKDRSPGMVLVTLAEDRNLSSTIYRPLANLPIDEALVPCYPLDSVLEMYRIHKIDVLSIDVEGVELEVWRSFDWPKHKPTVVIIEHNTQGRPSAKAAILDAFGPLPYVLFSETPGNLLFCLEGHLR